MSRRNVIARLGTVPSKPESKRLVKSVDDGLSVPMTEAQLEAQRNRDAARDARKLKVAKMRMSPLFEKYSGRLTLAQMMFVHYVVFNGVSLEDAVLLAFPRTSTWTPLARRKRAYNLLNPNRNRNLVSYYNDLRTEFATRMDEENVWTRGMATKELKSALDDAKNDMSREGVTKDNAGMRIAAIQELDRIHGLQKVDVTVGSRPVTFEGESELTDEVPETRPDLEGAIDAEGE